MFVEVLGFRQQNATPEEEALKAAPAKFDSDLQQLGISYPNVRPASAGK